MNIQSENPSSNPKFLKYNTEKNSGEAYLFARANKFNFHVPLHYLKINSGYGQFSEHSYDS